MLLSWMRRHELLVDSGTALVLAAFCVAFGLVVRADVDHFVLSLMLLLPLALRRRSPALCATVVFSSAFAQWLIVRDTTGALPADLGVLIAIHGLAAYGPVLASRLGLAVGLLGAVLGGLSWPQLPVAVSAHVITGAFLASSVVAAWTIGTLNRLRRKQIATLAERARLLDVEREQRDQLVVLAERTRIAREMHDIVAHSLGVLIAQADGGRYAAAASPEAATTALATIGDHARQALAETRRVLGVLRDGPGATDAPMPGVGDLATLVETVRGSGLDIRLTLRLPSEPVESGLALVIYRIVQEGLTNVIKYAGPSARTEVSVLWGRRELEIDVTDDGRAPSTGDSGYGVLGMRERVGAYGGTVTVTSRPGGGHVLSARIPVAS